MDLNTITAIKRPVIADDIKDWSPGHAWLAGGTWLFSEPQVQVDTLIDIETLNWPSLQVFPEGLEIAATCRIFELEQFAGPSEWQAAPLLSECCHSFLASFKSGMKPRLAGISSCPCRPGQ